MSAEIVTMNNRSNFFSGFGFKLGFTFIWVIGFRVSGLILFWFRVYVLGKIQVLFIFVVILKRDFPVNSLGFFRVETMGSRTYLVLYMVGQE